MKINYGKIVILFFLLFVVMTTPISSFAFGGPNVVPGGAKGENVDALSDPLSDDAPIDGGLSLLLVAGIGYGIKKVRERDAVK